MTQLSHKNDPISIDCFEEIVYAFAQFFEKVGSVSVAIRGPLRALV